MFPLTFSTSYQSPVLLVAIVALRTETHEPTYLCILLVGVPALLTVSVAHHASSILSATVATFLTFYAALSASVVIYRLSPWHPLAKYPGPLMCRISKLWMGFLSLGGKQHIYYLQLHEKYGDVVRIGPNELIIRDVNVVAPMMGPQGLQKGPFWDGRVPEGETTKPMIALRDIAEHARRRRPWAHAFGTAALKGYEEIVKKRSVQFAESVGQQMGAVDMMEWIAFLTNAIFMSHVPWLGALFLRFPGPAKDLKAWRSYAKKCAMERKKRDSTHKDIFHHLMDADSKLSKPPTVIEVVSDGGLAILAGSDTTSTAITNLIYLLLNHPKTYKRLQAEIDTLGENVMDYTTQTQLPYLTAVLRVPQKKFNLTSILLILLQKRESSSLPAHPEW
ncbi:hypothetical protein C0995_003925 [Termitomyces sp. Mi166|nr:hypothetical protein C0995_003925 [Termitomyces sp. Mi166\